MMITLGELRRLVTEVQDEGDRQRRRGRRAVSALLTRIVYEERPLKKTSFEWWTQSAEFSDLLHDSRSAFRNKTSGTKFVDAARAADEMLSRVYRPLDKDNTEERIDAARAELSDLQNVMVALARRVGVDFEG